MNVFSVCCLNIAMRVALVSKVNAIADTITIGITIGINITMQVVIVIDRHPILAHTLVSPLRDEPTDAVLQRRVVLAFLDAVHLGLSSRS